VRSNIVFSATIEAKRKENCKGLRAQIVCSNVIFSATVTIEAKRVKNAAKDSVCANKKLRLKSGCSNQSQFFSTSPQPFNIVIMLDARNVRFRIFDPRTLTSFGLIPHHLMKLEALIAYLVQK
jgi:hypothetical protein